jgi:DNA invertase Pin-like site-specific DNA recombinase
MKIPAAGTGLLIGYARVSTIEQKLDLQLDALKRAGVLDRDIYVEKISGGSKRRPALEKAIRALRPGDTLVVWRLDRMGRNLLDLLKRMEYLQRHGIHFRSLTESIDTSTIMGQLLLHILGAIAQFERQLTQERTNAGIRAHIERGGKHGREATFDKAEAEDMLRRGKILSEVAAEFGVRRQVIANHWSAEEARRLARLGPLKRNR